MLRNVPTTTFSQRRRRCLPVRFPFPPPGGRPRPLPPGRLPPVGGFAGGRPPPPPLPLARAGEDARARPPAAGRRAAPAPLLPGPALRGCGGRRPAPAAQTRA